MNERLKMFVNYLILHLKVRSNADLALKLGIAKSQFSEILSGKRKLSPDLVNDIHAIFPELNTEWVMSGEGEMCVGEPNYTKATTQVSNENMKYVEALESLISYKDKEIAQLSAMVVELKSKIARLQRAGEEEA